MSTELITRRLRPYLFTSFKRSQPSQSARTFTRGPSCAVEKGLPQQHDVTHDYEKRRAQLEAHKPVKQWYPRWEGGRMAKHALALQGGHLKPGDSHHSRETVEDAKQKGDTAMYSTKCAGRIVSIRTAGSRLAFVDIATEGGTVQVVCQYRKLQDLDESMTADKFRAFTRTARRGDVYSVLGYPHRTERGELSIMAVQLPELLSPSLHQIPDVLEDPETRARNRHVDMLVNPEAIQTLQLRHHVEAEIQKFFNDRAFVKVTTPLLSASAGGAVARPFETVATELSDEVLNLRIAPELWLKRLVVGGMDKVYEMGPAFRNEGVDATHNPEFNICEFYEAYASLDKLIHETQMLLSQLHSRISDLRNQGLFPDLPECPMLDVFKEIEFIPELEQQLGTKLPHLHSPDAHQTLLDLFTEKNIPKPANSTLPRLLDALAGEYLEPLSHDQALFITSHPSCMSPLSKHMTCSRTGQIIAARAELFIGGREYANMYEEENSPFEQRRKFEEQLKQKEVDKEAMDVDEDYLRCLEWGLPPTGGWGCGVDRLVMLFSGRERMSDVLAFGSLRNVVGMAKRLS